jgi:mono/diheme cytochrome c family protein
MAQRVMGASIMRMVATMTAGLGAIGATTMLSRTVWDGVYSEPQAARGKAAYEKECASCHGTDLAGGGLAPSLVADAFAERWKDGPVGDIFIVTKATMPQDRPSTLTDDVYADIVAYLLRASKYPSGSQDLSKDPSELAQITFDKPAQGPKQ